MSNTLKKSSTSPLLFRRPRRLRLHERQRWLHRQGRLRGHRRLHVEGVSDIEDALDVRRPDVFDIKFVVDVQDIFEGCL